MGEQYEDRNGADRTAAHSIMNCLISPYKTAYLVNLKTDTFTVLKRKNDIHARYGGDASFFESMDRYIESDVDAADRPMMHYEVSAATVAKRLVAEDHYTVEYMSIVDGRSIWHEMFVADVAEDEALIAFAARDEEITLRHITQRLYAGYYGIYVVDIAADTMRAIRHADMYFRKTDVSSYSQTWKEFLEGISETDYAFLVRLTDPDYLRRMFEQEDRHEYIFYSPRACGWAQLVSFALTRDAEGTVVTMAHCFSIVDSVQKENMELAEENRQQKKRLERALTFSNSFLDTFISAYYVGLKDLSCETYKRTRKLEEDYPVCDDYLQSITEYILRDVHPKDRDRMLMVVQPEYLADRLARETEFSVIMRDVSGGEEKYYRFQAIRGADPDHAAFGFVDITEDIREQKEHQKQFEEALAMAQSANRAKTTFLNNMSHDIRTPMNAIIGYTGLAATHIDNTELVRDYLSKISQSSDHLLSLINDVLDMSRIESGKMNLDEKNENISDIIHTLRDIVQADVHSKQLDFYVDSVDVNDEDIICDKLRLNQVLLNILSNAIKYTAPRGMISLRIIEHDIKKSGYATYEFTVRDNGMGMSQEFLTTIFDPFTRVRSSTVSGIQGTGLGMAITKNIIDMMGGTIQIESEEGVGTEVKITFEFKLQSAPRTPEEIPAFKGIRSLVVDDDTNTCLSVSKMIKNIGMRAEWCTSGKEAVIRAKAACQEGESFGVYIIDWLMPDMNGIETTRRIRKEIGPNVAIIVLTSYDWADIEEEARAAGVTTFVSKPLFPSDLTRVLEQCMGQAEEEAEPEPEEPDFKGRKVLLVEDNPLNTEIAVDMLSENGFEVYTADDGTTAVEAVRNAKAGDFDIILMDVQMPIMDGYEATRQIRALGTELSQIPIVAMTANAFAEDRAAALEAGMNEHIAKPIKMPVLKEMLARFLNK